MIALLIAMLALFSPVASHSAATSATTTAAHATKTPPPSSLHPLAG